MKLRIEIEIEEPVNNDWFTNRNIEIALKHNYFVDNNETIDNIRVGVSNNDNGCLSVINNKANNEQDDLPF